MMRWTIVVCVVLALGAALVGTHGYQQASESPIEDELLAYEITPTHDVTVDVPAGTRTVQLTTWALLPASGELRQLDTLAYAVEVEQWSRASGERGTRRYGLLSRVSQYGRSAGAQGVQQGPSPSFVARLAEGDDGVTDPRTIDVETDICVARGGRLRVRALGGEHQHLLVRLSYRFGRSRAERSLYERTLSHADMRRILAHTAALGFVDLGERARDIALSYWGRRLTAVGRKASDYRVRRLLVGQFQTAEGEVALRTLTFPLGPGRKAAFNFTRPVTLRVHGPPGTNLEADDGDIAAQGWRPASDRRHASRTFVIGPAGHADLPLLRHGVRTVTVAAETAGDYSFSLGREQSHAQVGDIDHITFPSGRVQTMPDVRTRGYYQLDPREPLTLAVSPAQGPFRLRVRSALPDVPDGQDGRREGPRDPLRGRIWTRVRGPGGGVHREGMRVVLAPSELDAFDEHTRASEESAIHLFPPAGYERVQLFGDPHLSVSASVAEPGVEKAEIHPAYAVPLAPEQRFENAPHTIGRFATIVPEDAEALRRAGRYWLLRAQVRLLVGSEDDTPPPERVVPPAGFPPRRRLWLHRAVAAEPGGPKEWFELRGAAEQLRVPEEPAGVPLRLRYSTEVGQLGQTLAVHVDGVPRHEASLVLTSGELSLLLTPGVHDVRVEGLGAAGVVYADMPPRVPMEALREYGVFELSAGRPLSFPVIREHGEPLLLVLFVVTEGNGVPWRMRYGVDGGGRAPLVGVFVAEPTERTGLLEGTSGELDVGLLWEGGGGRPRRASDGDAGVSRARVRLGDDLVGRTVTVRLSHVAGPGTPQRLWVRAVLVGQASPERAPMGRQWTREVIDVP